MLVRREFFVPSYFKRFKCKCGECRHTCCEKWKITLSLQEYFRLINLECSKELKQKINKHIIILDNPSNIKYAYIKLNEDNKCPFLSAEGLCSIQKKYSEKYLTSVCKLYPRSVCSPFAFECSCTNSCEKVIELLYEEKDNLRFTNEELIIDLPENLIKKINIKYYKEIREKGISILQTRSKSLESKLFYLSRLAYLSNECREKKLDILININDFHCDEEKVFKVNPFMITIMKELYTIYKKKIKDDIPFFNIEAFLNKNNNEYINEYCLLQEAFYHKYPDWEILFENVIINHMFYDCFPFSNLQENFVEDYLSLLSAYFFLKSIAIQSNIETIDDLVDLISGVFRIIEHSEFDEISSKIINQSGETFDKVIYYLLGV